ncbi:MAG: YegS/Rv2252/BmrU family lipid kinase [Anaerolineales bacterium]|jgi:diacylglycerol kinase (ATP)
MKAQKDAWIIYNPMAGRFPARPLLARAGEALRRRGWQIELVQTRQGQDLSALARSAADEGLHAVFVAGGDGSVGQVASALAGSNTALGVLPAGTANVMAQELGLPTLDYLHLFALEQAAISLAEGQIKRVDLGLCNGNTFLLWAGVGLDAHIVNSIEPRERWEKAFATAHYATLALWNSLGWQGVDITASAQKTEWQGRYLVAVACNIPAYAGGLVDLAPGAKIDDGLLDFWLLEGETIRDILPRVAQIFMGTHLDGPGLVNFRSAEATFELSGQVPMQLDGEPVICQVPLEFSVQPQAVNVIVPASARASIFD